MKCLSVDVLGPRSCRTFYDLYLSFIHFPIGHIVIRILRSVFMVIEYKQNLSRNSIKNCICSDLLKIDLCISCDFLYIRYWNRVFRINKFMFHISFHCNYYESLTFECILESNGLHFIYYILQNVEQQQAVRLVLQYNC